jgi:hypothetical protein
MNHFDRQREDTADSENIESHQTTFFIASLGS